MKNRSIKWEILINFFVAILSSIGITLSILFGIILILHKSNAKLYLTFINLYNTDTRFMMGFLAIIFIVFIIIMSFIFIKKMDKITNYIKEISINVNKVAKGNMETIIPIKLDNELGKLAKDVNQMIFSIKDLMEKEREWEKHKNNLITNISHDLRTPLTSVIGFLELIKNKKFCSEDELNHYCEISFNKANQLKACIDQLFEFTKLTNGDIKLNKTKVHINELIEQVTIGFIPLFQEKNMKYRILAEESKISIDGDPVLLARAFENIISNSIKYGSNGKYLDINIKKEDNKASISFINYGDMIEEEDLNRLFERLYRVEKKSNKKEGTGLGLAITKTIIEMHEGEILINSFKEKTEFKVICS
ncbi:ATP-binding protein [Clostridium sp. CTA-5]